MSKKLIIICLALAAVAWSLPARATSYSATVMGDSPLAFWEFDTDGTGQLYNTTCHDTTGNHNATYKDTSTTTTPITVGSPPSVVVNSATFYGSSGSGKGDYIDIPGGQTSGLEFTTGTLEFWVNSPPNTSSYDRIMQHDDGSGTPDGWGVMGGLGNPRQIGIFGCGSTWYTPWGNVNCFDNEWHYIDVTYSYDGTNTTEAWYADGQFQASRTIAGSLTYPGPSYADALIGAEGNPGYIWSAFTNGTLDEVAIYNYDLSAGQITNHYQVGMGIPEPATIALLSLGGLVLLRKRT
jgi:hypothetical protein